MSRTSPALRPTRRPTRREVALLAVALGASCRPAQPPAPAPAADPAPAAASGPQRTGRELAEAHCSGCHLFPEPHLYDRATWLEKVLPLMGPRLGITSYRGKDYRHERDDPALAGAGIYPDAPVMSEEDWGRLLDWYSATAPELVLPPADRPPIRPGLRHFRTRIPKRLGALPPMTCAIKMDLAAGRLYVGHGMANTLTVVDRSLEPVNKFQLGSPPISLRFDPGQGPQARGLWVLEMGSLRPTNEATGRLHYSLIGPDARVLRQTTVLERLLRPVHASYADLDRDGVEDVVVSEFGWIIGRITVHARDAQGGMRARTLTSLPGAIRTAVADFDGDGRLDVMSLVSQGDEGISIHHGQPDGTFREERVLRFSPAHGSSAFELADFDGDGHPEIVHCSGDNADGMNVLKRFHGVRIFRRASAPDGGGYEEALFFRMNGAYGARVRDFDLDGDLDVAAISFFADYEDRPEEGFVLLTNVSEGPEMRFEASTFAEVELGRWMVMDAGDWDRDGDEDLVLGSFIHGPSVVPEAAQQRWVSDGPDFVLLENTTR